MTTQFSRLYAIHMTGLVHHMTTSSLGDRWCARTFVAVQSINKRPCTCFMQEHLCAVVSSTLLSVLFELPSKDFSYQRTSAIFCFLFRIASSSAVTPSFPTSWPAHTCLACKT